VDATANRRSLRSRSHEVNRDPPSICNLSHSPHFETGAKRRGPHCPKDCRIGFQAERLTGKATHEEDLSGAEEKQMERLFGRAGTETKEKQEECCEGIGNARPTLE